MRVAFISDIHGNAVALRAVLDDIRSLGCDKVYVLGDICYRGPDPKACLELVQSAAADVLKGNADEWVVTGIQPGQVSEDRFVMMSAERQFTVSQLTTGDIQYLEQLPMTLSERVNGVEWFAFHATPHDLFAVLQEFADEQTVEQKVFCGHDANVFLYGHIHLPYVRQIGDRTLLNLGSVGLPFDGIPQASYAVVEFHRARVDINLRRVPYDVDAAIRRLREVDYPNVPYLTRLLREARP
ncbi:metallophosphoesterase family protein [Alicyclobacillus fastidiosus]|uniref:Metallophosphoesterase family protein n=1 Tax=Alicyclobacillus fastidiosus TaxID=392011 RepID=A0ABY6ZFN7_9BACL|nr:metallophosphoesterase family protein [Alicyclobacillus fastidiosus]WAH41545.1 metallophosphoesterase family protein [Alicyclobacillus fastidiosus]GMA63200.1 serine/threonine protein phosphatase [Alicyclobacillus fastidiosus]